MRKRSFLLIELIVCNMPIRCHKNNLFLILCSAATFDTSQCRFDSVNVVLPSKGTIRWIGLRLAKVALHQPDGHEETKLASRQISIRK